MGVVRSVGLRLASLRPLDRRRVALVGVFLSTRLVMAFLAGNPPLYTGSGPAVTSDVYLYWEWGFQLVASGGMPYSEVPIEYPPGMLPFVLVPAWLLHQLKIPFLLSFVVLMLMVDGLGLLALQRLGRRWGSELGAWLWVVALPLLGPIVLLRLDLVPAVATIWCLERAAADRWTAAGAYLGFGCLSKLYPWLVLSGTPSAGGSPASGRWPFPAWAAKTMQPTVRRCGAPRECQLAGRSFRLFPSR